MKEVNYNTTNYLSRGRQRWLPVMYMRVKFCPYLLRLRAEFRVQFSLRQHLWWPEQSLFAKWGEDLCIFPFGRLKAPIEHMFSHIAVLSQLTESLLQLTVRAKLTPSQGPVVTTPKKHSWIFPETFLRPSFILSLPSFSGICVIWCFS